MKDRAAAERACKDPNPIIDGRKANVNLAYLGAKPRNNVQLAGEEDGPSRTDSPLFSAGQRPPAPGPPPDPAPGPLPRQNRVSSLCSSACLHFFFLFFFTIYPTQNEFFSLDHVVRSEFQEKETRLGVRVS